MLDIEFYLDGYEDEDEYEGLSDRYDVSERRRGSGRLLDDDLDRLRLRVEFEELLE